MNARRRSAHTLIEVLVGSSLLMVAMAMAFVFFVTAGAHLRRQESIIRGRQEARVALSELVDRVSQAGFGVERPDPSNPAGWQPVILHGGSHELAFHADLDDEVGARRDDFELEVAGVEPIRIPVAGHAGAAEVWVFGLDADGDGRWSTADRRAAARRSWNPAERTACRLDYGLIRRRIGEAEGEELASWTPLAGLLFTNLTGAEEYPEDGTIPGPLFKYWLTEDLDGSGVVEPHECEVERPCEPHPPALVLWGDDDGDGALSRAEASRARLWPVGSPDWEGNPLASSGRYRALTIAEDVPSGERLLRVDQDRTFPTGVHVRVGDHRYTVEASSKQQVLLSTSLRAAARGGDEVEALPSTVLGLIRAVEIQWDGLGSEPARGRPGIADRADTKGLGYRVDSRTVVVSLANHQTAESGVDDATPSATPACGLEVSVDCVELYLSAGGGRIEVEVSDQEGLAVADVDVQLEITGQGTELVERRVRTDGEGRASVQVKGTGEVGISTLSAWVDCGDEADGAGQTVEIHSENLLLEPSDCVGVVGQPHVRRGRWVGADGLPRAGLDLIVKVGVDLDHWRRGAGVEFDESGSQIDLSVDSAVGLSRGTTDASGAVEVLARTRLDGTFDVTTRLDGPLGGRLTFELRPLDTSCRGDLAPGLETVDFAVVSTSFRGRADCDAERPCWYGSAAEPPAAEVHVSLLGAPMSGRPVRVSEVPGGASGVRLVPENGEVLTDIDGAAVVGLEVEAPGLAVLQVGLRVELNDPCRVHSGQDLEFEITGSLAPPGCDLNFELLGWLDRRVFVGFEPVSYGCPVDLSAARFSILGSGGHTEPTTPKVMGIRQRFAVGEPEVEIFAASGCGFSLGNGEQLRLDTLAPDCLETAPSSRAGETSIWTFELDRSVSSILAADDGSEVEVELEFTCGGLCPGWTRREPWRMRLDGQQGDRR